MVEQVLHIHPGDSVLLLGDLIDRGPDSKGVVDFYLALEETGVDIRSVRGNHESLFLQAHHSEDNYVSWMANDGRSTLLSFGVSDDQITGPQCLDLIPDRYLGFFHQMPFYLDIQDAFVVHAGLNAGIPDPLEDTDAMLWTRKEQYPEKLLQGKPLVHGHTPYPLKTIQNQQGDIRGKVIHLDGGCVYNQYPGYGYLVALNPVTAEIRAVKNMD